MKEIYCLPLTAATSKLHLGNLYSWILADSYKRASSLLGIEVELRESWNCFSKRLEDEVSSIFSSSAQVAGKCSEIVNNNISKARSIFSKYDLGFSLLAIRDDSQEYREIVIENYKRGEETGKINKFFLDIPNLDGILTKARKIKFYPDGAINLMKGISTLRGISSIPILREGNYGIKVEGVENMVLGQRYVQSLLPEFYKRYLNMPSMAIFGKDVLAKWVYFMVANSTSKPFMNIGLHGLILRKEGGKISKYDSCVPLIEEITSHPDNVRLSLLKQSFGTDFNFPDFDDEEKFRRKVYNCFNFFKSYKNSKEDNSEDSFVNKLIEKEKNISKKIRKLNFSGAYQDFKSLIYGEVSSKLIPSIKGRRISQEELARIVSSLIKVGNIFTPRTIQEINCYK
jgi:hypothetical protein